MQGARLPMIDLEAFTRTIGYRFNDLQLLRRALTHRSHSADHNERLEFLGDSVVNCVVALELFRQFPGLNEGDLSRLRASLVSQDFLSSIAQRARLGDWLLLGEGELRSGGFRRPSILADAVEAVVGAAFLDGGFEPAQRVVRELFGTALANVDQRTSSKDAKTLLQELAQSRRLALPRYAVVATSGEAHEQRFEVECVIPELEIRSLGMGSNRRSAEQNAARRAYELATGK